MIETFNRNEETLEQTMNRLSKQAAYQTRSRKTETPQELLFILEVSQSLINENNFWLDFFQV